MKEYKAKSGKTQYKPARRWLENVMKGDNSEGWCLACGKPAQGVEPDARKYKCACCKADKVYGAEELLLMGLYH